MKKCWIMAVALALLLGACAREEETFETVADDYIAPAMAAQRQIVVELPDNALAPALESDNAQVYMSDEYQLIVETFAAGDLNATFRELTGFDKDALTVLQTQQDDASRYDFVWACAGETGEQLGRGVILDDGNYHYCMSVLRDAADTENTQIVWRNVFESFALS